MARDMFGNPVDFLGNPIYPGCVIAYADRVGNRVELKLYLVTKVESGNKRVSRKSDEDQFTLYIKFFGRRWLRESDVVFSVFDPQDIHTTAIGRYERCVVIEPIMYNDECNALRGAYLDGDV